MRATWIIMTFTDAAREVPDTAALRFLTNFVRHKRLYD